MFNSGDYLTSRCLRNPMLEASPQSANTAKRIPILALAVPGVFILFITSTLAVDVPSNKIKAQACKEYLTGDIHCSHTIQSSIKGYGTKPPDSARNITTPPAPTRKVTSCVGQNIEVVSTKVFPTSPFNDNSANKDTNELKLEIEGFLRAIIGMVMEACTNAHRVINHDSKIN